MTAKFTGRYTASPRPPLFPFPPGSRLIGMLVSAFVGAGVARGGGFGKSGCVGTFIGVAEGLIEEGGAR